MSSSVSSLIESLVAAGKAYENNEPGAREALIDNSRALATSLEIPSEFLQRSFWAEPALSASIRIAVNVKLFQHLKESGESGLSAEVLSAKTGIDIVLLQRLARHLVAMHLLTFRDGAFHATILSNGLAEENYQDSIAFCYDTARPSFNGFPEFFQKTEYKSPSLGTLDGPFQNAHKTQLPFFDWLIATPPNLQHFDSFMSAYRAGKANWYDPGFYPVAERLITGFDTSESDVLLVDVGGGRGHDMALFCAQYDSSAHKGRVVLQDREPVIAAVKEASQNLPFEAQAHDFFTPQPIKGARAYSLHSILHDWSDEDGVKILQNLAPALRKGYSRVLFNEIVVSEEKPTLAATSMDLMMLAHFAVRERTEAEWKGILENAGLRITNIYTYPGVAESLIEAELA
ncbi:hydroxyindole O-methyltransferase, putative [Talaromyces stipitatus ATCC 10500]|uniref:Hydroxyindole O-methyltransferase, putative n=1 Tax=Talaromyces stipitatus (strain ATCC 10500 / CBS 375.48 / QM 6759 / NRRL 1006) TaxID=441959 RepID=B8M6D1_TALSN|nr:hydroxyindole O-methyltransferase, putative [Talaromyces stipitatus ATCC 10500]EED19306.1 hydroxyindole O-methyltransferase, putative [Talaromyces stipitatus ATCC 10500]